MKVLIVGGAGYLGGALTDILSNSNHKIRVYDALLYEDDYLKKVPFVLGDIRNHTLLKKHLQWADAVVWLAALVGDEACSLNPQESIQINQESVEWLAKNFNGRIIFTSTCSVYGVHKGILNEDSPINPLSVYGETKLAAEKFLANKNAIIFRLGTLYGLGDHYARIRLDLVLNTLVSKAVNDGKIEIYGGKQFRPLLHVSDAAAAIAQNLETKHTGIFNLHNQNIKIIDLAKKIKQLIPGTKMKIINKELGEVRNYQVSSKKAKAIFGFDPKIGIEDGIKEVKQIFEENRIKDSKNPKYTNKGCLNLGQRRQAEKPQIINGAISIDDRGQIIFANEFDFKDIKRFYIVENHKDGFIRAWHGHKKESKYVMVLSGSALVGAVKIDNWNKPYKKAVVESFVLSSKQPKVLYIPAGYANGFMNLTPDTQLIFYSTSTIDESKNDDYRYSAHYWDIWKVKER